MRLLAAVSLVALGGAISESAWADLEELERNRARWSAAAVSQYQYGYNKYCECHLEQPPETIVTVMNGAVARVHHRHPGSEREVPARDGSLEYYWTIEDLFALLETAFAGDATVRASYDEELGYPLSVYIDYVPDLVGDEIDVRLTRLTVDP